MNLIDKIIPYKEKVQFVLLALLCCFPVLPQGLQSIGIILFIVFSIWVNFNKIKNEILLLGISPILVIIAWLIILYTTTLYSFETKAGIIYIRKSINIFLIPFVIFYCYPKLTNKQIELLLKFFVASSVIFVFYLIVAITQNLFVHFKPNIESKSFIDKVVFLIRLPHSEIMWYGIKEGGKTTLLIHKTYLSINFVYSVFIILYLWIKKKNRCGHNIFLCCLLIFFSMPVFFFLSFINIFILIFGLGAFGFLSLKKKKSKILYFSSMVFLTIFTTTLVYNYAQKNKETQVVAKSIVNKINLISSFFNNDQYNNADIDARKLIYKCSFQLVKKRPIFGYGLGEQHIHLTNCYAENGDFVMVEDNYNSHNFYMFLMLSGGIMVLIPFIIMFLFYFKHALRNNLLLLFLVLIALNLLFENVLVRINGILFFSLFLPLLFRYKKP